MGMILAAPGSHAWDADHKRLYDTIRSHNPELDPALARLFVLRFLNWVTDVTVEQALRAFEAGAETVQEAYEAGILAEMPPDRYWTVHPTINHWPEPAK